MYKKSDITQFHRNKYGRELLVDCGLISQHPGFLINDNAFVVNFFEIYFVSEGAGVFYLNETEYQFERGTILLLPPGMVRRWGQRTDAVDAHYLIFEEEFIQRFFKDPLFLYRLHFFDLASPADVQLNPEAYQQFLALLGELQQEITSLRDDSDHLLRSLLYYALIKINRLYEVQHQIQVQPYNNLLALKFKSMLEQHFAEERQVAFYCSLLGTSRATLNKHLKVALGKSAGDLIRERVVQRAKQKLIYTDERISKIAYQLNFDEVANFNRLFVRLTGLSPREFRRRFTN